jgi:hypothetical protein
MARAGSGLSTTLCTKSVIMSSTCARCTVMVGLRSKPAGIGSELGQSSLKSDTDTWGTSGSDGMGAGDRASEPWTLAAVRRGERKALNHPIRTILATDGTPLVVTMKSM